MNPAKQRCPHCKRSACWYPLFYREKGSRTAFDMRNEGLWEGFWRDELVVHSYFSDCLECFRCTKCGEAVT